ncbi:MAG: nucleotidyltransferase domain-containing protein [Allosphingosinicella sp.]
MRLSAEFLLAVACCRWPPSPESDQAVRDAAAGVDWDLFADVARRHRIEGLVWAALRRAELVVPGEVADQLAAAARDIARRNLQAAAESMKLRRAFDAAGVPILFIKGLTLGALAYGDPAVKMSWDIDVLVDRSRVAEAAALLEHLGYKLSVPRKTPRDELEAWHDRSKESVWHNPARSTWVELHTRLVDNARLLGGVGWPESPREVEVAKGLSLPTLRDNELFAYLCVHGASSAWFRFKWVADLGALLSGRQSAEIERLYQRSQELGAGRAAAQGLLLCHALCGTDLGDDFYRRLSTPLVNRLLLRLALRKLAGRSIATEPTRQRLGTLAIHLTQFGLLPGWSFKFAEARRQLDAVWRGYG